MISLYFAVRMWCAYRKFWLLPGGLGFLMYAEEERLRGDVWWMLLYKQEYDRWEGPMFLSVW